MPYTVDPSIVNAIIQTESSGRPGVIGDVGHPEGSSYGQMQIQENTAKGLFKRGLLPQEWNGKKVKRKNLQKLLLDPEFNRSAGEALMVDNRRMLENAAYKGNVELRKEDLDDLMIRAHNQGAPNTIKKDLLKTKESNPDVDTYLQKVKKSMSDSYKPITEEDYIAESRKRREYADGGVVDPITGMLVEEEEEPLPIPYRPEEIVTPPVPESLMEDTLPRHEQLISDLRASREAPVPETIEDDGDVYEVMSPGLTVSQPTPEPVVEPSPVIPVPQEVPTPKQEELPTEKKEDKKGITTLEKKVAKDADLDRANTELLAAARKDPNPEVRNEYDVLMKEYEDSIKEKNKAKKFKAMLGLVDAIGKYGSAYGAGKAQVAGGFQVQAPSWQNLEPKSAEDLMTGSTPGDIQKKLAMMAQLKKIKGTTAPKGVKVNTMNAEGRPVTQLVDPATGKQIGQDFLRESKSKSGYSKNADDGDSLKARNNFKQLYPEAGMKITDDMSEDYLKIWGHTLVNRTPTKFRQDEAKWKKMNAESSRDLAKIKREGVVTEQQAKRRDRDEKAVRDVTSKLAGLEGARSVYAKALLRETLANDGLRVIQSIEENKFVASEQIAEELATVMASTLQGGNAATRDAISGLIPHTSRGDAMAIKQYLMGTPQAYLNKDFLNHFKEQLKGQRDYWKENLKGTERAMYISLRPVFSRQDKDGVPLNEDLREIFNASLSEPPAPKKLPPVRVKRVKDGKTMLLDAKNAQKYLDNPGFEVVK